MFTTMTDDFKDPRSQLDEQHKKVLLRDAKHFFKLNQIWDTLKVDTLYELIEIPISKLSLSCTDKQVDNVLTAMKKWNCAPANYHEPKDITYYDNTGKSYWVDEHGYKNYHNYQ
mgnify:CR=1 FL=1